MTRRPRVAIAGTGGPYVLDWGPTRIIFLDTAWWLLQADNAERDRVLDWRGWVERFSELMRWDVELAAAGETGLYESLRGLYPDAKILLNAVLPYEQSAQNPKRQQIIELNRKIATLGDGKTIIFKDYGARFLLSNGDMSPEVMADFLHPTPKGYQIWADAIKEQVDALVK